MSSLLQVKNLYWRPNINNAYVLKDINLNVISTNEIIVVKGPASSGKSCFLKILSKQENKYSGTVIYKTNTLKTMTLFETKEFCQNIAFIDDYSEFLPNENIYKNLEYVLELHKIPKSLRFDRIMHVLKLTDMIHKREQEPGSFSTHEKRLFALAVAFARDVEMIICDFNLTSSVEDTNIARLLQNAAHKGVLSIVSACTKSMFEKFSCIFLSLDNGQKK